MALGGYNSGEIHCNAVCVNVVNGEQGTVKYRTPCGWLLLGVVRNATVVGWRPVLGRRF